MVDYNRLFNAHNGDDAWELLKEACSTDRRDKHHEMLLVVDESSLEKHLRGSQYQRMILASSGKTVTISQRHELKVILRLSQARPGPPSGRPQGEGRQVDVGASSATSLPMTLCYSPVYPHSPHTPHISICAPSSPLMLATASLRVFPPTSVYGAASKSSSSGLGSTWAAFCRAAIRLLTDDSVVPPVSFAPSSSSSLSTSIFAF